MGSMFEPKTAGCLVRCGKCPNCLKHAHEFELAAKTIRNALTFIQRSNDWNECSAPVVNSQLAEDEQAFQACEILDLPPSAKQAAKAGIADGKTAINEGKQVIKDSMTELYDHATELRAVVN